MYALIKEGVTSWCPDEIRFRLQNGCNNLCGQLDYMCKHSGFGIGKKVYGHLVEASLSQNCYPKS